MSTVALNQFLKPIKQFMEDPKLEEIIVNRPGEVLIERRGIWETYSVPEFDSQHLKGLANLIAEFTAQDVSETNPLLSAITPEQFRVQVVMPPACPQDMFGLAIRKPSTLNYSLDDYQAMGAFNPALRGRSQRVQPVDHQLAKLLREENIPAFLRLAVNSHKNIIISGGTSSGKTTVLKAMIREMSLSDRILTIEDVREVFIPQENKLHLLASKGGQGKAQVTVQSLLEACLRLRPDRIMLGELRGAEAFFFLRAINTGHPGSISSLHADTTAMCFEQLSLMVMQAGVGLSKQEIMEYIKSIVHIVLQFNRFDEGFRGLSDIYYVHAGLNNNGL